RSWSGVLASTVVFGFSIGLMGVAQNSLASAGATQNRRQQILSGLHAMYGLASLLAPLLVNMVAAMGGGWREALQISVVPFLLLLIYCQFSLPRETGLHQNGGHRDQEIAPLSGRLLLGSILALYVMAEIMVSSRLVRFLRLEAGFSPEDANLQLTYFFLLLLFGRALFTLVRIPFSTSAQMVASLVGTLVALILGLWSSPFWLIFTGFTMAPFYPLAINFMSEVYPRSINGVLSVAMALQSVSVVLMHLAVGSLTDFWGIRVALWVGPVSIAVSLLLLLNFLLRKKYG
ncbi:MAG: hypothetical protein N2578_04385, partial [Bdellovibrionaceae bacterium]|nr:hypothetical protein [Pseudobdellovibrionaceae bacterium]